MKKILALILIIFLAASSSVSADTVAETAKMLLERFDIAVSDNTDILRFYKNHGLIDDSFKPVMASAINAGLLMPVNGILAPESNDVTCIKNGLISFGLKNEKLKFTEGKYSEYKLGAADITKDTIKIGEIQTGAQCTALVDAGNKVTAVWESTDVVLPAVCKAKVYVKDGGLLVVYDIKRHSYNMWINEIEDRLIGLDISKTNLADIDDEKYIMGYVDKEIFFIADLFNKKVIPLYF